MVGSSGWSEQRAPDAHAGRVQKPLVRFREPRAATESIAGRDVQGARGKISAPFFPAASRGVRGGQWSMLSGELFKMTAGVNMIHVPYRSKLMLERRNEKINYFQ
jgi:hypothetical protein